ncbi:hypothetical protein GCM10010452_37320 [Crossiella cryophila]
MQGQQAQQTSLFERTDVHWPVCLVDGERAEDVQPQWLAAAWRGAAAWPDQFPPGADFGPTFPQYFA